VKNIFLFGFYGQGNLGDEILLENSLKLLAETEEVEKVTVLSPKLPKFSNSDFELSNVSKYNFPKLLKAINSCDGVIGGGGGIFQDETSLRSFLYYASIVKYALTFKKPVLLLGHSIGPLKSPISRRIMKEILSSDLVYPVMRDPVSYRYARMFSKNATLSTDLAFLYEPIISKVLKDEKKLSLSLKELVDKGGDFFQILRSLGFEKIDLLLFFPREEEKSALKNMRILEKYFEVSIMMGYKRITESIASSNLVITQRLHGAILSFLLSTKFIASKNQKIIRMFQGFPYPGFADLKSSFEIVQSIEKMQDFDFKNYRKKLFQTFTERAENIRKMLKFFLEAKYTRKNLIFKQKT